MSVSPQPHNAADALAEHLAARIHTAVAAVTATAKTMTGPTPPPGGYAPISVTLRRLLDAVTEQAITYDLYAGPGLAAVAEALGVTERTARTRYGGGPRDLPLLTVLDQHDE